MTQEERDQLLLDLKNGQEELFKGQEERDQILLDLKNGQEELFKGQEERDQILLDLKNGQKELSKGQDEMKKDLRSLSQTVAKIEVEHGEKIQIALDVLTSHSQKFDSIENRLESIENKVDRHSHEIYYLNSKVHAF